VRYLKAKFIYKTKDGTILEIKIIDNIKDIEELAETMKKIILNYGIYGIGDKIIMEAIEF